MLERYQPKTPAQRATRVVVGPAAILSAGAGVAIGVIAALPMWATVLVALGCWSIREMVGMIGLVRRDLAPHQDIDPYAVPDPWRSMVRQAVDARNQFRETVARWPEGPTRERLDGLSARVSVGADQVDKMAKQAAELTAAAKQADAAGLSRQLASLQAQAQAQTPGAASASASASASQHETREEDLARRLRSARQLEETSSRLTDRLGVLVAQLNDAVTHLVGLSLPDADEPMPGPNGPPGDSLGPIQDVVAELEALHSAFADTHYYLGETSGD